MKFSLVLDDGRYTLHHEHGTTSLQRHGEPSEPYQLDNPTFLMAVELAEARKELETLRRSRNLRDERIVELLNANSALVARERVAKMDREKAVSSAKNMVVACFALTNSPHDARYSKEGAAQLVEARGLVQRAAEAAGMSLIWAGL